MSEKKQLENMFTQLQDEAMTSFPRRRKIVIWSLCLLIVGIYLFFLLFGSNSWSVLSRLKKEKQMLEMQTENLQKENVVLQKTIFELKGLEPQAEE